jgi:hypothetical protein
LARGATEGGGWRDRCFGAKTGENDTGSRRNADLGAGAAVNSANGDNDRREMRLSAPVRAVGHTSE